MDLADLQSCYGTNSASSLLELSVNSLKEGRNRRFHLSWRKLSIKSSLTCRVLEFMLKLGVIFGTCSCYFKKTVRLLGFKIGCAHGI